METRRAQGFLDHEMLIEIPSQQLKIVGNSVDRNVAFAIGLVMKESWDSTLKLRREMLQGNELTTELTAEQKAFGIDGHYTNGTPTCPTSTHEESVRRGPNQKRTEAFATILQKVRRNRQEKLGDNKPEDDVPPPSQRWSGETPADAITVRRRVKELKYVLYADRGCSP